MIPSLYLLEWNVFCLVTQTPRKGHRGEKIDDVSDYSFICCWPKRNISALFYCYVIYSLEWRNLFCLNFETHDKKGIRCCHELMCCSFLCCTFQILGSTEKARKVPDVNPWREVQTFFQRIRLSMRLLLLDLKWATCHGAYQANKRQRDKSMESITHGIHLWVTITFLPHLVAKSPRNCRWSLFESESKCEIFVIVISSNFNLNENWHF